VTRTAIVLDRRPLWCNALEQLLGTAGVTLLGSAADSGQLLERLSEQAPDIVIVDVDVDPESGLEAIRRVHAEHPFVRLVALAREADDETIREALRAGVRVVCVKTAQQEDLLSAVRLACADSIFVAPAGWDGTSHDAATSALTKGVRLTKRELEILGFVAEGHSNAEVARSLWVTEQTVKFHLSNIYRKLGVTNRTEASRWAQLNGILARVPERALSA
jgi:DNA-binding NarL/FixJ family response regulator